MRKLSTIAGGTLAIVLGVALSGCGYFDGLQGKMAFRDANGLYQAQDYRGAAEMYEETLAEDPSLTAAYFYLANSYDNLYRPTRRGEPENDMLLDKAIENYRKSGELEQDPALRQLALEYLVNAYGPDKMNDPDAAEPILQQMITANPTESANYFVLSRVYEDLGEYDSAESVLLDARAANSQDVGVLMQMAGYYGRLGEFEKAIEALQSRIVLEPNNPEAHQTLAAYYWDEVYRDFGLTDDEKSTYLEAGVLSADKAIELKGDYIEALTYKGLLLRLQAELETDRDAFEALLEEANALRDLAQDLQNQALEAPAGEV